LKSTITKIPDGFLIAIRTEEGNTVERYEVDEVILDKDIKQSFPEMRDEGKTRLV